MLKDEIIIGSLKKLKRLFHLIKEEIPMTEGRYFVDSAPVLERSWAQRSGLGWIGKNGNLQQKTRFLFFYSGYATYYSTGL